jgi:thioredoxin-like negative regulator of GroEL
MVLPINRPSAVATANARRPARDKPAASMNTQASRQNFAPRSFHCALLPCFLSAAIGCARDSSSPAVDDTVRAALARGDYKAARRLAAELSPADPDWADGQVVLGEAAIRAGDAGTALKHFAAIPRDGSPSSLSAALAAARFAQTAGQLSAAIDLGAYVLEHDPRQQAARGALANLYATTGQRSHADRHLWELVKSPDLEFKQLVLLTDYERRHPEEADYLKDCEHKAPDDPAVNLGLAVELMAKSQFAEARRRVESAVAGDPRLGAAQALLGELRLDEGDAAMQSWHANLPPTVQDDPEIWYVRGLWAQQRGEKAIAARCFWECVRQVPHAPRAMYQLGVVLTELEPDIGPAFVQRAQQLYELKKWLSDLLNRREGREAALQQVIGLLLESGREWEAWSWSIVASERFRDARWVAETLGRLEDYPQSDAPRVLAAFDLAKVHDLSHYPRFDELLERSRNEPAVPANRSGQARIQFVDDAAACGIDFVYHQGHVPGKVGVRMQESTGGGVSVLDVDCDGRPDLFFTQGEEWPDDSDVPAPSAAHQDRLYRNRGSGFRDMTRESCLPTEGGFGQGCSAGDFNDDGFVDLYVANIGVNQLLLNNGDGTFTDVTSTTGLTVGAWTSSCLIADINADGFPDLFDVNYVEGESLYRIVCNEHYCSPLAYASAADHVHVSSGDGVVRLLELVGGSGSERGGAGLGVVAFRPGPYPAEGWRPASDDALQARTQTDTMSLPGMDPRRLALFVANDQEPNFFFVNSPADNAEDLLLTDVGFMTGLAFNKDGRSTACMGVASGDFNGDRLLDLFVTNYKGEANNLYVQDARGWFTDAIAGTGLLAPGLPYVGWGAQFLDADNNGQLDIVVANGHVADFHEAGVEYQMPTQFFRNQGDGSFEELPPEVVGPFFGQKIFGRSLAALDWNRDGRIDFVLSSIASPAALLTNQTEDAGNHIAVRLRATSTARDAIGAFVTVATSSGQAQQQLTAGDGYQATNERVLRFGLGPQDRIEQVVIVWPSGRTQTFRDVPANTRLDVVEGLAQATLWTGDRPMAFDGR